MRRGLATLGTATWFAGLRRSQAASRAALNPLEVRDGRFKMHPIFDWSDRDVYLYLKAHSLPYHPLWDKGYVSIGDWHSTKALHEVDSADELRFSGPEARSAESTAWKARIQAAAPCRARP
jgi:phosphoadenosine phosphosulfate reductase